MQSTAEKLHTNRLPPQNFVSLLISRHSVGAQSTLGEHNIFARLNARKICMKINKMPEFYMILAQKLLNTLIFMIFTRKINKIPEFYVILSENA